MDLFVTRAADLARAVETAGSSRAFRSAVDDFEQLLSRVSDYPPDFPTDSEGQALSSIADTVVERIERRLDAHSDRAAVQRELAETSTRSGWTWTHHTVLGMGPSAFDVLTNVTGINETRRI